MHKIFFFFFTLLISLIGFADTPTANWMSTIPKDRTLNEIIIPGTHDSGSYAITPSSHFSLSDPGPLPTWLEAISNILPVSILRPIVAGWSKTQPYTISDQLNNGIRYFDFRICYLNNHFYFCHTMLSDLTENGLDAIAAFAKTHPSEILILDFNHIYGVTDSATQSAFLQLLQNKLGDIAIPNSFQPTDTIETMRESKKQVIILMDTTQPITPNLQQFATTYLWHESNINSPWPDASHTNDLKNDLDTEVAFRAKTVSSATNLFVLQAIKTADNNQVINGIIAPSTYPNNINSYEAPVNQALGNWINNDVTQFGKPAMNIIIQDWFTNESTLVPLAIQYDSEMSVPQKINRDDTQLNKLKQWMAKFSEIGDSGISEC